MKPLTFEANGKGIVIAEPDVAYFDVGVTITRDSAAEAMAENNRFAHSILKAIHAAGVATEDIKTNRVGLEADYDYVDSKRIFKGYRAENTISVTLRDLERVAAVIDATVNAGANDIQRLDFDKKDKQAAYDEALKLAVINATEKINVMAEASQCESPLRPKKITEQSFQAYGKSNAIAFSVRESADSAAVMPGVIEITAEVHVVFEARE